MLHGKKINRICYATTALMLIVAILLWGTMEYRQANGLTAQVGYETLLFDTSVVHTIDIEMDGWDAFIAEAENEEYHLCNITVDGEAYHSVAIRAKGNTSLSSVSTMGSTRYSFKVEFDHYDESMTYHGLDKLCLNNMIQDATMMKDYLAYTLMNRMGVPSPLCSYVQVNVNGEPWGLYLAVEGIEEGFLERTGQTRGELYKPDSLSFGGGRGNGRDFDFSELAENIPGWQNDDSQEQDATQPETMENTDAQGDEFSASSGFSGSDFAASFGGSSSEGNDGQDAQNSTFPGNFSFPQNGEVPQMPEGMTMPDSFDFSDFGSAFGGMGSNDVKLIYSDDDPDSYSNIFDNAKTKVTKKDKARLIESLRKLNAQEDLENTVDQLEVIRYLAVHHFLCNDDSYTGMMVHNYYLYEENGKLRIIPWDYNLSFGGFSASQNATSTVNSPMDSPVSGGTTDSRPLIAWIFSDEEALAQYHEVYSQFLAENVENGYLAEEIARISALITPYLEQDTSLFYTMDEYTKALETLQVFCAKRGESLRGQLDGTIPSTSAGQQSAQATLIDASEISTSTMGSMNNSMPGGGDQPSMPGNMSMPDNMTKPDNKPDSMPDMGGQNPPGQQTEQQPAPTQTPEGTTPPETTGDTSSFGGNAASSGDSATQSPEATTAPETTGDTSSFGGSAASSGDSAMQQGDGTNVPTMPQQGDGTNIPTMPQQGDGTNIPTMPQQGDGTNIPTMPQQGDGMNVPTMPQQGDGTNIPANTATETATDAPTVPTQGENAEPSAEPDQTRREKPDDAQREGERGEHRSMPFGEENAAANNTESIIILCACLAALVLALLLVKRTDSHNR